MAWFELASVSGLPPALLQRLWGSSEFAEYLKFREKAVGGEARQDRRIMLLATTIACSLAKNDPAKVSRAFATALDSLLARPSGRMRAEEIRANLKSVVTISKGLKNGRNRQNRNHLNGH